MRAGPVLRLCARPEFRYRQGQRPEPGIREYFYYLDHHGRLFLDDAKVKNFVTCFKDIRFLSFFFRRLQPNLLSPSRFSFPFVSRCGRERNFLRCSDLPVVFTRLLPGPEPGKFLLSYNGGGSELTVPFRPGMLTVLPENGRVYHPAPEGTGGVGLVSWELAAEWSEGFEFQEGMENPPTGFWWGGERYRLQGGVREVLRAGKVGKVGWEEGEARRE